VYRQRGETVKAAARRAARKRAGLTVRTVAALPPVGHAFSHFHLTLTPVRCAPIGHARVADTPARWIAPRRPRGVAVHAIMEKIIPETS
jgi:adenine-specific DNA glycosylase